MAIYRTLRMSSKRGKMTHVSINHVKGGACEELTPKFISFVVQALLLLISQSIAFRPSRSVTASRFFKMEYENNDPQQAYDGKNRVILLARV